MKMTIETTNGYEYFIAINGFGKDLHVARSLEISIDEYIDILKKFNSEIISKFTSEYFFKNLSDAKNALETLESYLIFKNLTGG